MKYLPALLVLAAVAPCARPEDVWRWNLPKGFPKPWVPADNPMSAAKVELGRYLFYDKRLSVNGRQYFAACHRQELAFTDGRPVGIGTTGEHHQRGAMSLGNIAWSGALTWNNPALRRLEDQALTPMFGDHPVELGLKRDAGLPQVLERDAKYRELFARAFPGDTNAFTIDKAIRALACFERSIISARSPYDRYHYGGDDGAVSKAAKRGEVLFFSQQLSCFRCHGGFNFSDATVSAAAPDREIEFHNTGVNAGREKFKAPTLRNIALTAPYMHDGSMPTLDAVLDHYASGGRAHDNPAKDALIGGFALTEDNRKDLIAFLESLTDTALLHDARFSDPFFGRD